MSDREFDHYLALLSGLLRLGKARQASIADELRAHLEDRLQDLLDQGRPRQEAVRLALTEFGDAAGLAAELTQISREQRRRWMMRTTVRTVTVTAAAILVAMALWPDPQPRGVMQAQAQNPGTGQPRPQDSAQPSKRRPPRGAAGASMDMEGMAGGMMGMGMMGAAQSEEANTQRTRQSLSRRVQATFDGVPLSDVLSFLGKQASAQVFVDQETMGDGLQREVTLNLEARVDMLLDLVLRPSDFDYVIRDGIVIVSTHETLLREAEVRIYNCRDLLNWPSRRAGAPGMMPGMMGEGMMDGGMEGMGGYGDMGGEMSSMGGPGMGPGMMAGPGMSGGIQPSSRAAAQLLQLISRTVEPESWIESGGGAATITEFNGLLVVKQHAKAHEQIGQLLNMLREANDSQPGFTSDRALTPRLRGRRRSSRQPANPGYGSGYGAYNPYGEGMMEGAGPGLGSGGADYGSEDPGSPGASPMSSDAGASAPGHNDRNKD